MVRIDVPASFWQPSVLQPREWEPRLSVAYQLSPNDALRFAYGRSAVFGNAQSTGTPFTAYNITPYLKIPPIPGFQCGIPTVKLFPCQSYGEQLYWLGDQIEAPDAGNGRPALYSNYDVSYSHQFKDGLGFRLTPFYKVGQDLPTFALATQLPGGGGIFAASNYGFNRHDRRRGQPDDAGPSGRVLRVPVGNVSERPEHDAATLDQRDQRPVAPAGDAPTG